VSFTPELETVFRNLFEPLGVSRLQFQKIAASVHETRDLEARQKFATENVTPNDNLSLVVSGKLQASENRRRLQHVGEYEFLEASEWFDDPESDLHQVSVKAVGDTRVIVWNREKLRVAVSDDLNLRAAVDALVGKDVARKLNAVKSSQ
ncbi:unnamed protein product, partial [Ixodes hexagonus]